MSNKKLSPIKPASFNVEPYIGSAPKMSAKDRALLNSLLDNKALKDAYGKISPQEKLALDLQAKPYFDLNARCLGDGLAKFMTRTSFAGDKQLLAVHILWLAGMADVFEVKPDELINVRQGTAPVMEPPVLSTPPELEG